MPSERKLFISVKGERSQISSFVRKAYDLSMQFDIPITVELRKGSWEAIVFHALDMMGKAAETWLKDPNNLIKLGTYTWKLLEWIAKKKLTLTGIGQDAARGYAAKILKNDYHLICNPYEEEGPSMKYPEEYRFVFKCNDHIQKTVLVNKKTGKITKIYDIDEFHSQKDIPPSKNPIKYKKKNTNNNSK